MFSHIKQRRGQVDKIVVAHLIGAYLNRKPITAPQLRAVFKKSDTSIKRALRDANPTYCGYVNKAKSYEASPELMLEAYRNFDIAMAVKPEMWDALIAVLAADPAKARRLRRVWGLHETPPP